MEAIPLAPEDRAILDLEGATIAGHTCKVILLDENGPDLTSLRALVAERLSAAPALSERLAETPRGPAWVPDDRFDPREHVVAVDQRPIAASALPQLVATLFAQHLDRSRPLWRVDVATLSGGGSALIWRIHHALADGTTALRYAHDLLWDHRPSTEQPAQHPAPVPSADDARRRGHLIGFVDREFARSREHSPFDGRIGTDRQIAFAHVPMGELHRAAKDLCGATLNDAVLSTVAGALRRWIIRHHGHLGTIRVKVPVSLHHEGHDAANRDSFFTLGIPLNDPDPVSRLRVTHHATSTRKSDHDAATMDDLLQHLGVVSPALEHLCVRIERSPRSFALNVSNIPGPRQAVSVLGSTVQTIYTIAEIGERHALRVSVLSFGDTLTFGLCADPGIVHNVGTIADGIAIEARSLTATR